MARISPRGMHQVERCTLVSSLRHVHVHRTCSTCGQLVAMRFVCIDEFGPRISAGGETSFLGPIEGGSSDRPEPRSRDIDTICCPLDAFRTRAGGGDRVRTVAPTSVQEIPGGKARRFRFPNEPESLKGTLGIRTGFEGPLKGTVRTSRSCSRAVRTISVTCRSTTARLRRWPRNVRMQVPWRLCWALEEDTRCTSRKISWPKPEDPENCG